LSIGGNPFHCSCQSSALQRLVRQHYSSLREHRNITVECEGELRILTDVEDLCKPWPLLPMLILSGVTILMFMVFLLLHIFYGDIIIIWVFSQSWGKVFFSEDLVDKDKPYDAFLSYSHKDSEYVETELLPGLESPDNPDTQQYRCLIHNRDWVVGETIPDQILDSVAASRRTIVILSQDFLQSTWSKLEFQAAHSRAIKENTQRVILILHGSLPPTNLLDQNLQNYIKANTAIRSDDPWFWQKLRFALPKKVGRRKRSESAGTVSTEASDVDYFKAQISQEGLILKT